MIYKKLALFKESWMKVNEGGIGSLDEILQVESEVIDMTESVYVGWIGLFLE